MKTEYKGIELEIIAFTSVDVITASNCTPTDLERTETDPLCMQNA